MSTIFEPVDSSFSFTSPVRKFKANDPYLASLDNIPVAQLEQNTLWLKDQIENGKFAITDVGRNSLAELRPYVTGGNRLVNVAPGRFTARVNTPKTDLELTQIYLNDQSSELGTVKKYFEAGSVVQDIFAKLTTTTLDASASFNLNGLEVIPTLWDVATNYSYQEYQDNLVGYLQTPTSTSLPGGKGIDPFTLMAAKVSNIYGNLSKIHSKFVLMWGSVIRTAIVDVPSALTVEIDEWDDNDFTGSADLATSRIDLVFIYTHPVDASATKIIDQRTNLSTTINKAELGIVKGAGFTLTSTSSITGSQTLAGSSDVNSILANPSDQLAGANTGFIDSEGNEIHGSFPSPDDLMNITPNLVAQIESEFNNPKTYSDVNLIGQSILPIAYVVVKKTTASVTSTGKGILSQNDIIDIRPFFRTTELSYNERAGIAAATPPLSFANPVVGKAQVDSLEKKLVDFTLANKVILPSKSAVVARGTVYGGLKYGPEGTLMVMNGASISDYPSTGLWTPDNVLSVLNPTTPSVNGTLRYIPDLPEWDLRDFPEAGVHELGKYINTKITSNYPYGSAFSSSFFDAAPPSVSQSNISLGHDYGAAFSCMRYLTKIIRVTLPTWAVDYDVNVNYENCIPATTPGGRGEDNKGGLPITFNGIMVSKRSIVNNVATFIIVCMVNGKTGASKSTNSADIGKSLPTAITDANLGEYAGFVVPFLDSEGVGDISVITIFNKQYNFSKAGVAIIPSVAFSVVAYNQDNITFKGNSTL